MAIIIAFNPVKSQTNMNWEWARTAGGYQTQKATGIAVDSNNDVIIAGTFTSNYIMLGTNNVFLSNSDTNSFSSNYFVAKYNQNGQVIWAKKAICNTGTSSNKIVTDNNGNIYACGFINNSNSVFNMVSFDGNSTYTHNNGGKSFLVKYSSQGIAQWVMFINNKYWGYDTISALKWDEKTNSILIGGYCLGDSVNIGNQNVINTGNNLQFSFIAKIDIQLGNVVWLKKTNGNSFITKINDIDVDSIGSVYVAASFSGNYLFLPSNDSLINSSVSTGAIFSDGYFAKYNQNGILEWVKKGICQNNDEITTISCLKNNKIIIGGYNKTQLSIANNQLIAGNFILEYDLQGNFIDAENFPATIKKINALKTGNGFTISGNFTQDTLFLGNTILLKFNNPAIANSNIFVTRCDSFGIYNSAISAGDYSSSQLNSSFINDSNKVYICGFFSQPSIKFGSTTYNSIGISDLFLAKLDIGSSIPIPLKYNLGGTVFAGLLPVDFAIAYIYNMNQNIIETCYIDSLGFYQFFQKTIGNYKVSAELVSNSIYFQQNYISSFYPNKLNFADAETIVLNANKWNKDIYLQKSNLINENFSKNFDLKIFPNPAKDKVEIVFKNMIYGDSKLKIINVNGQIVISEDIYIRFSNEKIQLEITSLKSGLYYLVICDNKGNVTRKKLVKIE